MGKMNGLHSKRQWVGGIVSAVVEVKIIEKKVQNKNVGEKAARVSVRFSLFIIRSSRT